ncbi:MAG: hypothetical protein B6D55_06760 [Candidatus Omnitrophica bacterium 4484_70.2]|nr:MAG: hypothetical protein B6D55_06760 [Candidatus Omnitrophica bacterium 4484_70.2]
MDIFDRYYKKYDSWYQNNKFAYQTESRLLKKVVPSKGRGMEIGVGTGRFSSSLNIKYGLDTSFNMLKIAKLRGTSVVLGEAENLPFKKGKFDYLCLIITFCFLENPLLSLKEAYKVLKRGGKIIIAIIDRNSFLGKYYQKKKSVFYKYATFYTPQEVREMLKMSGFKNIQFFQTLFDFPENLKSVQNFKRGYGEGGFVVICGYKYKTYLSRIQEEFIQHERVRHIFKKYGYDMEKARSNILKVAGKLKEPILDVGTGPGRMACILGLNGYKVISIDISSRIQKVASLYARKFGVSKKIKFIKMDAQDIKFKDNYFSTVISANLLHEVSYPQKVVEEMIRVAKKKGKIIISDLNTEGKKLITKVNKIYPFINVPEVIDFKRIIEKVFINNNVSFKKYSQGIITTYIGIKS